MTIDEAIIIIKTKLQEFGHEIIGDNNWNLSLKYEDIRIDISCTKYYGYRSEINYDKVDISLKTSSYGGARRGFKSFDVVNGDYEKLSNKIKEIVALRHKEQQDILKQKMFYRDRMIELVKKYKDYDFKLNVWRNDKKKINIFDDLGADWKNSSLEMELHNLKFEIDNSGRCEIQSKTTLSSDEMIKIIKILNSGGMPYC